MMYAIGNHDLKNRGTWLDTDCSKVQALPICTPASWSAADVPLESELSSNPLESDVSSESMSSDPFALFQRVLKDIGVIDTNTVKDDTTINDMDTMEDGDTDAIPEDNDTADDGV